MAAGGEGLCDGERKPVASTRVQTMNIFGVDVITYLAAIVTVLFFAAPVKWFLGKVWSGIKGLFGGKAE
jgi:hypothetical protein